MQNHFQTQMYPEKLIALTRQETTHPGTSGGQHALRTCGIFATLSGLLIKVNQCLQETLQIATSPDIYRNKLLDLLNTASPERRSLRENPEATVQVYDILNAGPRSRFCTSKHVAHNCLALGYGAGFEKFIEMAKNYINDEDFKMIFGAPTSQQQRQKFIQYWAGIGEYGAKVLIRFNKLEENWKDMWVNSWEQVTDFRESNPCITGLWQILKDQLIKSHNSDLNFELPGGRSMKYRKVLKNGDGYTCAQVRNGVNTRSRIYAGLLSENITQAFARDVFRDCALRVIRAGYKVIMRIHDEVVIEVDESDAQATLKNVTQIMSTPPTWCPNLPVGVEAEISKVYKK